MLVIGSAALHLALFTLLPGSSRRDGAEGAALRTPAHVELELLARGQGSARTPAPIKPRAQASAARLGVAQPREPASARSFGQPPQPSAPMPATPAPTPTLANTPVSRPPAPAAAPQVAPLDLSPRAVALGAQPAPQAPAVRTVDDLAAERGAALSSSLRAAADADARALRDGPELALRRDPDGTCHYVGEAIDATILPDGGVQLTEKGPRFEPREGLEEPPERPVTLEDLEAPQQLALSLTIRPNPSSAEREWFMRQTQALRAELADAAHARALVSADAVLRKQLDRIWCDAARPKPVRRRAIFELWTETSADRMGERGRRVIIDYILRHLPEHGPDAYPAQELAQLRLAHVQGARFDPYAPAAAPDAGTDD